MRPKDEFSISSTIASYKHLCGEPLANGALLSHALCTSETGTPAFPTPHTFREGGWGS